MNKSPLAPESVARLARGVTTINAELDRDSREFADWMRRALRFVDLCVADAIDYSDNGLQDDGEHLIESGFALFGLSEDHSHADLEHVLPTVLKKAQQLLADQAEEITRLTPKPTGNEKYYGVAYRPGEPSIEDYDEAIADLQRARTALTEGDSMGCRVCEDSGHGADSCHHNVLLLARRWAAASSLWQCWHCGYIATNAEEGREHFGLTDSDKPACQRDALDGLETAIRAAEEVVPDVFWLVGKGRLSADEPPYGAQLLFGEEVLSVAEGDTPAVAITAAVVAYREADQ